MASPRHIEQVVADGVIIGKRLRPLNEDAVQSLMKSIIDIGLQTPITVRVLPEMEVNGRKESDVPVLVAGAHRLEAVKRLGSDFIDAYVFEGDERDARMWEIAENLHRADLTVLERSEQVAEWVRLAEERGISRQVDEKLPRGRPESGRARASRDIGVSEPEARRAEKVAALAPEAKDAARAVGLDNNQSALLAAAKAPTPEAQVASLQEMQRRKQARKDLDAATDTVVKKDAAADLAVWMRERMDREDMPMVVSWLEAISTKDLIRALRREFMEGAA